MPGLFVQLSNWSAAQCIDLGDQSRIGSTPDSQMQESEAPVGIRVIETRHLRIKIHYLMG